MLPPDVASDSFVGIGKETYLTESVCASQNGSSTLAFCRIYRMSADMRLPRISHPGARQWILMENGLTHIRIRSALEIT